jgi:hypothetical protein
MLGMDVGEIVSASGAAICSVMAVLQYGAARKSLSVAWQIAADQAAQTERIRLSARTDFINIVAALARDALHEADKAETALNAMTANAGAVGILSNFYQRLTDLHNALQPIRTASPPDASLILAVGKLSRAFEVDAPEGFDRDSALLLVKQHRGSIGIELGKIQACDCTPSPVQERPAPTGLIGRPFRRFFWPLGPKAPPRVKPLAS